MPPATSIRAAQTCEGEYTGHALHDSPVLYHLRVRQTVADLIAVSGLALLLGDKAVVLHVLGYLKGLAVQLRAGLARPPALLRREAARINVTWCICWSRQADIRPPRRLGSGRTGHKPQAPWLDARQIF